MWRGFGRTGAANPRTRSSRDGGRAASGISRSRDPLGIRGPGDERTSTSPPRPPAAPASTMGAPVTSPCDGCDARCCSAYAVHVTGDDVWRISAGLGLEPHAFLTYAAQAVRTATGFVLRRDGPSHELLLAHARSADRRPPCPFLRGGDGAPPRCGVYPFRPRACRRFPAVRLEAGYGVRDGLVCPPGAWAGHDMARLSWRVALGREDRELETYAAVVAVWNERVERAMPEGEP